jgi:hypothetical protein
MFIRRAGGVVSSAVLMTACASIPDVTASYYFPKAETQITIAQSLACNSDSTKVISAAAVTAKTAYSSDYDIDGNGYVRKGQLRLADLNRAFSDTDISLNFTDDGRLAGINCSNTGQGSTLIKNTVSLASLIVPLVATAPTQPASKTPLSQDEVNKQTIQKVCSIIKEHAALKTAPTVDQNNNGANNPQPPAGSDQNNPGANNTPPPVGGGRNAGANNNPQDSGGSANRSGANNNQGGGGSSVLTLTYSISFLYKDLYREAPKTWRFYIIPDQALSKCGGSAPAPRLFICPDANSQSAYKEINAVIPMSLFTVETSPNPVALDQDQYGNAAFLPENGNSNVALLDLNRIAVTDLIVRGPAGDLSQSRPIWQGQYPVPLREIYQLPIPKAAAFGKQQFTLSLSSYGSITKMEYNKTSGAGDLTDSAAAVAKALQKPTAEQEATALSGQAHLIYQTERLAQCQAEPAKCSSK